MTIQFEIVAIVVAKLEYGESMDWEFFETLMNERVWRTVEELRENQLENNNATFEYLNAFKEALQFIQEIYNRARQQKGIYGVTEIKEMVNRIKLKCFYYI